MRKILFSCDRKGCTTKDHPLAGELAKHDVEDVTHVTASIRTSVHHKEDERHIEVCGWPCALQAAREILQDLGAKLDDAKPGEPRTLSLEISHVGKRK